jgi:nucleoside-diphosphate-sugar epimerase
MRVFVTGGTGFIGSYLVNELRGRGHEVLLLSRQYQSAPEKISGVTVLPGSLADIAGWAERVKKFQPRAAVHLAWEGLPDYSVKPSIRNLDYGLKLVTLLAEAGCESIIGTGSCWEYGRQTGELNEDMVPQPDNAFTAAKNALRQLGGEIAREHVRHFIWTRLFYVYGPGQRETSLIPHIIGSIKQGKRPDLKAPAAKNDFIYVEDVARAITAIVERQVGSGVYNIGSGISTSVGQIVDITCRKLDFTVEGSGQGKMPDGNMVDFWADISRIERATGWEPETGIEEGIEKTIEYYRTPKKSGINHKRLGI